MADTSGLTGSLKEQREWFRAQMRAKFIKREDKPSEVELNSGETGTGLFLTPQPTARTRSSDSLIESAEQDPDDNLLPAIPAPAPVDPPRMPRMQ